jgi:hypothetical protein
MTAAAAAPAARVRPFGLARADLLKLRKRRGLFWTAAGLIVGPMVIAYGILTVLHAVNPAHHGPAGGIANLGHGMSLLVLVGSIGAIIAGATAGQAISAPGFFASWSSRDARGLRSSAREFRLAFVLSFAAVAYGISAAVSVAASGYLQRPSATLVVEAGLWVFAELGFYAVLAVGLASLTGSRAYTIGILLAWRTAVSHILVSISTLGVYRELLPDVPFARLAPDAVEENVREVPSHIGISLPASIGVLLLWAAVLTALGAWRTATRDA